MPRPPVVAVALCLLAVTAGASAGNGAAQPGTAFELAQQQFDRVEFRITVHADGSARWTFHYERTLANDSERDQFEAFAETFTTNETRLYTDFKNQSRAIVQRGQDATGREMAARSFDRRAFVTTQLDNDVGVVEMAFTWTGFARTEGDRVMVGDVFEGGLYVGPDQSLVIRAGEGLAFRAAEPQDRTTSGETLATSDTVTWQGERTFPDNHPFVVLGPAGGSPGPTVDDGPTTGAGTTTAATETGSPLWPVGLVLAVIGGALAVFLYRRGSGGPAGGGAPVGGAEASSPAVDEVALLNDEERVAGLLQEHGGRMRQSAIVEATGWSKSKVSMVLSEMADDGEIRKLRVGRENIISLPGHEPDATRSSLDDEE